MAYETGNATGVNDLIDKLRIFCVANGWTQNGWADDTKSYYGTIGATGKRLHLSKNSFYVNLRSVPHNASNYDMPFQLNITSGSESDPNQYYASQVRDGIAANISLGYDGGQFWDEQPNAIKDSYSSPKFTGVCINQIMGAIPTYHFLAYGDYDMVAVIVEYPIGTFQFLVWGRIQTFGGSAWTGGEFVTASAGGYYTYNTYMGYPFGYNHYRYPNFWMRAEVDASYTGKWYGASTSAGSVGYAGRRLRTSFFQPATAGAVTNTLQSLNCWPYRCSPSSFNGVAPFFPILITVERDSNLYSPAGVVPYTRQVNITSIAAGEIIAFGADQWIVFPSYQKGSTRSLNSGVAFRYGI